MPFLLTVPRLQQMPAGSLPPVSAGSPLWGGGAGRYALLSGKHLTLVN